MEVAGDRTTLGRLAGANDVALEPDPHRFVSRHMHCSIEREGGRFWLIDNASKNGTFLERGGDTRRVEGRERLESGDTVRILAAFGPDGEPAYWAVTFVDPQATAAADVRADGPTLEYDWVQARLFVVSGTVREEVAGLRAQEHSLIRYMDQRNRSNGGAPVMCTYEELLGAVWDEVSEFRTRSALSRLVWGLRQKVEEDPRHPRFVQTIRGMGYRLVAHPPPGG